MELLIAEMRRVALVLGYEVREDDHLYVYHNNQGPAMGFHLEYEGSVVSWYTYNGAEGPFMGWNYRLMNGLWYGSQGKGLKATEVVYQWSRILIGIGR
jgi:hypothetical protein